MSKKMSMAAVSLSTTKEGYPWSRRVGQAGSVGKDPIRAPRPVLGRDKGQMDRS